MNGTCMCGSPGQGSRRICEVLNNIAVDSDRNLYRIQSSN